MTHLHLAKRAGEQPEWTVRRWLWSIGIGRYWAARAGILWLKATAVTAGVALISSLGLAADCPGNCPPSAMDQTICALPASDLIPRQSFDSTTPPTFSAEKWELDAADNLDLTDGVELRQGGRVVRSQKMHYNSESGDWTVPGAVELSDPNLVVRGEGAHASTAAGTVDFETTSFELPARFGHGSASRIRLSSEGEVELRDVRYTTCPGPKPDWEIEAARIDIDGQARIGTARNAWVNIKGVPVFYVPYLSFPVGSEPKSGFLFPSIGNSSRSGSKVAVPWYWSIASNYDATITPTWYSRRGVDLGTEFRFLTHASRGVLQANYLPDEQTTGTDRSFVELHGQTDFSSHMRLYMDGSNVSDTDWLEDFGSGAQRTGVTALQRVARLVYRSDEWSLVALTQNYQTIDPEISGDERPYTLLPQVGFLGWFPDRFWGLTLGIAGEYSNFRRSEGSDQSVAAATLAGRSAAGDGQRLDVTPELRLPLKGSGAYIEPAIALRYTAYQLDVPEPGYTERTPSRTAPIISLDSGLIFERPSGRTQQRIQTLEPRLLYLYVPYRPQDNLPIYDTQLPDFNLIQLFGVNRYVGADRLGDANQVAMGVTTRLLDSHSGQQYMSATLGEVYRFVTPRVNIQGEITNTASSSDLIGELKLGDYKKLNASLGLQWDPNSQQFQRTEMSVQYLPGAGRVVNVGYVYRRNRTNSIEQTDLKQIDGSAAWPVGNRVNLYARYVYSLQDQKMIDGMAGVEYRDCCWGFRFGIRQAVSLDGKLETSWQWQVELNGLASVGTANDAFLAQTIRGYSAARFDRRSVP